MHICIVTTIGSDNGLSPGGRHQAIIWTNAGILLIGPLGTNFSEILIGIQTFSLRKCIWKCRLVNGGHLSQPPYVNSHMSHFISMQKRPASIKRTEMPPVLAVNLLSNSSNTAYKYESINSESVLGQVMAWHWYSLKSFWHEKQVFAAAADALASEKKWKRKITPDKVT